MLKCASEGPDLRSGTRHPRPPEAAGGRPGWAKRVAEACWITPQPLCHPQPCAPCGRRLCTQLKAKSGREGRGWCQLRQLEEELCQFVRPTDQVVEVFHLIGGEDSRRRLLCPWRAHPLASTLPAVARATAGRFMRCEYLIGRVVDVQKSPASGFWVGCSPVRESLESGGPAALGRQWLRPLTTDRQPCGEQLTQKQLATVCQALKCAELAGRRLEHRMP